MLSATDVLPLRRSDLRIREVAPQQYVIKHAQTRQYFRVGPIEHFLLLGLDGTQTAAALCESFEQQFGEPLGLDELDEFVALMRKRNLIALPGALPASAIAERDSDGEFDEEDEDGPPSEEAVPRKRRTNWLFFRKSLFDPDWMLNILEPMLRWVWTPAFLVVSAAMMLLALAITVSNRADLVAAMPPKLGWQTVAVIWSTVIFVTILHEFAHGLTCKHFGGDVHEIGVLMIFFTPCLYCNVSDAWLMPKKSHRLWITFAGGYCDLCVWALAVFVWRFTFPGTVPNILAWVTLTVCSGRILINLNPFMRMDGYYIITDLVGVPNLRPQANAYLMEHMRWLLWGAPKPAPRPRGLGLVCYGFVIWCFSLVFLDVIVLSLLKFVSSTSRVAGLGMGVFLVSIAFRKVFRGFFEGEVTAMIKTRRFRTACWVALLTVGPVVLFTVPMQSTVTGEFEARPGTRLEIHSPVPGFLRRVLVEEGDTVTAGQPIAELEVPDLPSLIVRKEAEIRETRATLNRLQAGTRPEELAEQKHRVSRAEEWKALAERDLEQAEVSLQQDLLKLDLEIKQFQAEIDFARSSYKRAEFLYRNGALAGDQLRMEKKKLALLDSQLAQSQAQRKAREAEGTRAASAEVGRRDKELSEARSALSLLEAGSRPEDIEAALAKLARLKEELEFLNEQQSQLVIKAPAAGIVATPRMREKVGQFADKGVLVCVLEDPKTIQVEIQVQEEDVPGIAARQDVHLKTRALPFSNLKAFVDRIAPTATMPTSQTQKQSSVRVYCHVDNDDGQLKSGMTGFARIDRGRGTVGMILVGRALKLVRTEYWW